MWGQGPATTFHERCESLRANASRYIRGDGYETRASRCTELIKHTDGVRGLHPPRPYYQRPPLSASQRQLTPNPLHPFSLTTGLHTTPEPSFRIICLNFGGFALGRDVTIQANASIKLKSPMDSQIEITSVGRERVGQRRHFGGGRD